MNDHITADDRIVEGLFVRDENSLTLLKSQYWRFYESIIREILDNEADVQECANDLLLGVWNSIPPNRPVHLAAYIAKLARRISVSRFRYNKRQKRDGEYAISLCELEEALPALSDEYETIGDERLSALLSDFLRRLDTESRVLFVRRYVYLESVSSLSKRFGISENNLSVRLYRLRSKLKAFLEKGGICI